MTDIDADVILDTKGMHCPLPVLKTKRIMNTLKSGQILELIATDPVLKNDIPALLKRLGHELLQTREKGGVVEFYIRKK
jgi:tRNA 2-thiouridine synthesizing protein A